MITAFNKGWYVAYTRPNHEKKCALQLDRAGIDHFLPCVKKLRQWSDRRRFVDEPLLPSYLFVWLDDMTSYFSSLDINGILYYVREGNRVATISEAIIGRLKQLIAGERNEIEVTTDRFSPGTMLVIKDGPFTGLTCEVVQHKGHQKILVRIELIQRSLLLDLPAASLMTVPASCID